LKPKGFDKHREAAEK